MSTLPPPFLAPDLPHHPIAGPMRKPIIPPKAKARQPGRRPLARRPLACQPAATHLSRPWPRAPALAPALPCWPKPHPPLSAEFAPAVEAFPTPTGQSNCFPTTSLHLHGRPRTKPPAKSCLPALHPPPSHAPVRSGFACPPHSSHPQPTLPHGLHVDRWEGPWQLGRGLDGRGNEARA